MSDRDPRYAGGRVWGCLLPAALIATLVILSAVIIYAQGGIQ